MYLTFNTGYVQFCYFCSKLIVLREVVAVEGRFPWHVGCWVDQHPEVKEDELKRKRKVYLRARLADKKRDLKGYRAREQVAKNRRLVEKLEMVVALLEDELGIQGTG